MEKKLNVLLSDLIVFYHKLQNFHWYVSGLNFFQVHGQLEEMYNGILPQIDSIGELILMINGKPVSNMKQFLENAEIEESEGEFQNDVKKIFEVLKEDYKHLLNKAKEIKADADDKSDYLVSANMDELIGSYNKVIWMISQASK